MGDGGTRPAYNIEFSTDLNSLVIMGADVINAGTDSGQMEPMVEKLEAERQLPEDAEGICRWRLCHQGKLAKHGSARRDRVPVKAVEKTPAAGKDPYAPRRGDSPAVVEWRQRMGARGGAAEIQAACQV